MTPKASDQSTGKRKITEFLGFDGPSRLKQKTSNGSKEVGPGRGRFSFTEPGHELVRLGGTPQSRGEPGSGEIIAC